MTRNIGNTERVIRAIAGLAILSLVVILDGNIRWIGLLGLMPLTTAAIGYCPPYQWLGINTYAKKDAPAPQ
jgi:hypothetical protein